MNVKLDKSEEVKKMGNWEKKFGRIKQKSKGIKFKVFVLCKLPN